MITGKEIGERFIRAVEITECLERVGPSMPRSAWVETGYSDADKNGWGAQRIADERRAFWNAMNRSAKAWEFSEAEETTGWLAFVESEQERRALTGWAKCMATGQVFKDWCKGEGIVSETGRRRKERAILRIMLGLSRKPLPHNDLSLERLLPDTPEISDKAVMIADDVPTFWMRENAKPMACDFDTDLAGFDWSQKRNELRRQRSASSQ